MYSGLSFVALTDHQNQVIAKERSLRVMLPSWFSESCVFCCIKAAELVSHPPDPSPPELTPSHPAGSNPLVTGGVLRADLTSYGNTSGEGRATTASAEEVEQRVQMHHTRDKKKSHATHTGRLSLPFPPSQRKVLLQGHPHASLHSCTHVEPTRNVTEQQSSANVKAAWTSINAFLLSLAASTHKTLLKSVVLFFTLSGQSGGHTGIFSLFPLSLLL